MRLTTVILIASLMQVSAAGLAQKITLSERNASLVSVFNKIRTQSGFDFLVSEDVLKSAKPVDVQISNMNLEEALKKIFKSQSLQFSIKEKTVVVSKKPLSFMDKVIDYFKIIDIKGKVLDENGSPLIGAIVKVKGTSASYLTDKEGNFSIANVDQNSVLQVTYIGYVNKELKVAEITGFVQITMVLMNNKLEEVEISTGYQKLPKERATGSFEQVDRLLLNRGISTDVITRLVGVTTGTSFGVPNNTPGPVRADLNAGTFFGKRTPDKLLTLRGLSTLNVASGGGSPLVVLDNFPYVGDINNINPNDIESVTLLKDATAASIWGFKSANGVIVITTKKAKYDQPLRLSVSTNVTIGNKPDLFYQKQMSSSDYIDIEKFNFQNGFYDNRITHAYLYPLSPVIELLAKQRGLPITDIQGRAAIDEQIDVYRNYDRRNDYLKYLYQTPIYQQYAMDLSGGSKQFSYLISGGYDNNKVTEIGTGYHRINLRSNFIFTPIKNLDVTTDIYYTNNKYYSAAGGGVLRASSIIDHLPYEPYTRLADDQGNHLEVINPINWLNNLKASFRKSHGNGRLLNWAYVPLDDIGTNEQSSNSQNILMNLGINYKINNDFNVSINYRYGKNVDEHKSYNSIDSYAVREMLNAYALFSTTDLNAAPTYQLPLGGVLQNGDQFLLTNSLRGQLNFNKTLNDIHEFNAIAGIEGLEDKGSVTPYIPLFGFNKDQQVLKSTPYGQELSVLNGQFTGIAIPSPAVFLPETINRNVSIFTNASYTYDRRYTLSGSLRKDGANIYGVTASSRVQPFWSVGGSWNISNESFFKPGVVQTLKLRVTYGYMGNVNNTVSAYPLITYGGFDFTTNQNLATINNPPNPDLRPERSGMVNFGLDFTLKNNRLSGSIEYYDKRSKDLIAPTPLPASSGFDKLNVNSANLKTTGTELTLNSINLQSRNFRWTSNFRYSYTHNLVTKYLLPKNLNDGTAFLPTQSSLQSGTFVEGHDPFSLYTYKWAGLDPETGDPRGYDANGNISKDWFSLLRAKFSDLEDHGSIIPLHYGSFINTFNYKAFSVSASILYKFKYKLNPAGMSYYNLYSATPSPYGDYAKRWQKPGDEKITNVPSSVYPVDLNRDNFYLGSGARVISGDHIRLRDIRISYDLPKTGRYFKSLQIYSNITNLGIIWRANKEGIDPDTFTEPPMPITYTLGIRAGF